MLFSLANQFNTYTSPLLLHAGSGSSVLNGTRHSCIVLLTYSEDKKCLCLKQQPYQALITNRLGQHCVKIFFSQKQNKDNNTWRLTGSSTFVEAIIFPRVCKNRMKIWKQFSFPPALNLALDRIAREKAICVWLLSLASPEPGWAWASKCQSDKDQAWQTDTGVLSFRVSSLC